MKALNAADEPRKRRPRASWMKVERRRARTGTASEVVSFAERREKKRENGSALSRAKAQVMREEAQRAEMEQNNPVPKTARVRKGVGGKCRSHIPMNN
jgi:hypothetical protein